jgi:hypothetical protein
VPSYYNLFVSVYQNLPNRERLSVVLSTIMLAYGISQAVNFPAGSTSVAIGGILVPFTLNIPTIITIAVAGVTASGTDWVMRDHPALKNKLTLPHLLLPTLSAWVLSVSLNNLADVPIKWVVLIIGGIFIMLVILAEYIVLNPQDYRSPIAVALLTAIAYAMLLALAVALVSTDQRLIVLLPAIVIGVGVLSMRIFQLQTNLSWPILEAAACTLMIAQLATALHYLPVTPISFGLLVMGALFSMINFILNIEREIGLLRSVIEAVIPSVLTVILALWLN